MTDKSKATIAKQVVAGVLRNVFISDKDIFIPLKVARGFNVFSGDITEANASKAKQENIEVMHIDRATGKPQRVNVTVEKLVENPYFAVDKANAGFSKMPIKNANVQDVVIGISDEKMSAANADTFRSLQIGGKKVSVEKFLSEFTTTPSGIIDTAISEDASINVMTHLVAFLNTGKGDEPVKKWNRFFGVPNFVAENDPEFIAVQGNEVFWSPVEVNKVLLGGKVELTAK